MVEDIHSCANKLDHVILLYHPFESIMTTIWHFPGCGTSKRVLEFLQAENLDLTIKLYQQQPPSISEIQDVLIKMKLKPMDIIRKKDKVFKEQFADQDCTDAEWIAAMSAHPSIIERPIVIRGEQAWLARPADEFISRWHPHAAS